MKLEILCDAISDNFMKAVNHGPWSPTLDSQGNWTTYCNWFVGSVSKAVGCQDLWPNGDPSPKLANEMYDILNKSTAWMKEIDGKMAQFHANQGCLVLAAKKNPDGHGHICLIRPGQMVYSGHWNKSAPRCMNVGISVFIDKTLAYAFETEPDYFVWLQSLPEKS